MNLKRKLDETQDKYIASPGKCGRSSDGGWDLYDDGVAGSLESCQKSCDDDLKCTAFTNMVDNSKCFLH